ncbi:MAG TPA: dienelactone hydrolase family protein [Burkholderiales bacterium]|nr:dienelactone hydrolase family protein [Burkholderiales bacterium]
MKCFLELPETKRPVPAIVLASAIHGVDEDLKSIAREFVARGYIAAAPDLFWRSVPGPLPHDDPRSRPRGQPRLEKIKAGEQDMIDVRAALRAQPLWNGRAAVIGFCYGAPYAILGPKRLGYDAGIACHGTQMLDYLPEMEGLAKPVCVIWGDQDIMAPPPVLEAYRAAAARQKNLDLHIFPGVKHSYMMPHSSDAFDPKVRAFSLERAFGILAGLR